LDFFAATSSSKGVGDNGGVIGMSSSTLGWENSRESFKNVFENLGVVFTPLKCFQRIFGKMELDMGSKGVGGFITVAFCISVRQTN
jgi:hypothetical protein